MDPCAKLKARQAARSSAKDSRHSTPSLKHVEEHTSSTPHPPVLARAHAHQYNQSQKHVSHTVAQPMQQPPAANTMHLGIHNSAERGSYHSAPPSKHVEQSAKMVSSHGAPPSKHMEHSAERVSYHGAPPSKHVEEPVSTPPVLARAHAHQFIQYGSDTPTRSKGQPASPLASNTTYSARRS